MQRIPFDLSGVSGRFTRKVFALQRAFNWQLLMPNNINGLIGLLVSQYCQDIRFGDYSIREVSALRFGSKQRFYAGLEQIGSVTLVFVFPVDNSVVDYFYGWRELVVDEKGYYHAKKHYAKDIYVDLYDRSGIQSTQFKLKGCWPKTNPIYGLAYAATGLLMLEVELSVDKIEHSSRIGSVLEGGTNFAKGAAEKAKGVLSKVGF